MIVLLKLSYNLLISSKIALKLIFPEEFSFIVIFELKKVSNLLVTSIYILETSDDLVDFLFPDFIFLDFLHFVLLCLYVLYVVFVLFVLLVLLVLLVL